MLAFLVLPLVILAIAGRLMEKLCSAKYSSQEFITS
jgi:hypothetical protein